MASEPLEIERPDRAELCPLTMENVSPFLNAVRREDAPTMILDFTNVPYLILPLGRGQCLHHCAKAAAEWRLPG
jgi:hypothetical protein